MVIRFENHSLIEGAPHNAENQTPENSKAERVTPKSQMLEKSKARMHPKIRMPEK
jgi:hypothetical protein